MPEIHAASVLVVEDDISIRELLTTALRFAGHEVDSVGTGPDALQRLSTQPVDLVVLDVGLPGIDGFELCELLRRRGDRTPIIFLTARREPDDLRAGFEGGGDDYLTKPFRLEELRLRVDAVLRRTRADRCAAPTAVWRCADLEADDTAHQVRQGGRDLKLTPTQYRVLLALMRANGAVLSKAQILDDAWGHDVDGDERIVETYISDLRAKLDVNGAAELVTVRGFGYALRPRPQ
jgi:two-component system OmpR family response regulator